MRVLNITPSLCSRRVFGFRGSSSFSVKTSLCCNTASSHAGTCVKNGSSNGSAALTAISSFGCVCCVLHAAQHNTPTSNRQCSQRYFIILCLIPHLPHYQSSTFTNIDLAALHHRTPITAILATQSITVIQSGKFFGKQNSSTS